MNIAALEMLGLADQVQQEVVRILPCRRLGGSLPGAFLDIVFG